MPKVVVTARSMRKLGDEAVEQTGPSSVTDPVEQAMLANRYNAVLAKIDAEAGKSSEDVLVTAQDREASMVQSLLAERASHGEPLAAGGLEAKFGEGAHGGDIWGWFKSLFDHIDSDDWHPIVRPPNDDIGAIADVGRIAIISDWGTALYGARASAKSILDAGGYEMVLHLGDVYYSGTKSETKERLLDVWPTAAGKIRRALNGNHEMYSGGFAYFDDVLPAFGQSSSYFALQNDHWLLVCLDTAHTDHDLDDEQARWIERIVDKREARKVIFFSHHQPFSRLEHVKPALQKALARLFTQRLITVWYWGHEHDCVVFDRHPDFGLLGRCVGNGGIPAPRRDIVRQSPIDRQIGNVTWRRLEATTESPGCLVLDGPNPLIIREEEKFGPHGYLTLDFDGPQLIERIRLSDSTILLEQHVD